MSQQRYLSIRHLIITIIPNISKLEIFYEDKNANAYDTLFLKMLDSVKHFRAFHQSSVVSSLIHPQCERFFTTLQCRINTEQNLIHAQV